MLLMYSYFIFLPFWIELKPSWCIALTAYCQSRPESCARRGTAAMEGKRCDFTRSRNDSGRVAEIASSIVLAKTFGVRSLEQLCFLPAEYFNCRKMSGNPAEMKVQCEPIEPTEGPTDFP